MCPLPSLAVGFLVFFSYNVWLVYIIKILKLCHIYCKFSPVYWWKTVTFKLHSFLFWKMCKFDIRRSVVQLRREILTSHHDHFNLLFKKFTYLSLSPILKTELSLFSYQQTIRKHLYLLNVMQHSNKQYFMLIGHYSLGGNP